MDCFHDYCLACDKQCNDSTYCSQSCRLADLEKGNRSASSSPTSHNAATWSATLINRMSAEASKSTSRSHPTGSQTRTKLTPSSSRSSLLSTSSLSSTGLTEQARLELQEYFSSFDQTRAAKRRSSVR